MARGRHRNRDTEEYVARKQVNAIGGGLELQDLMRIIDAKGGDYYRAELSPREGWREAYDHFGMTGKRATLDLQDEIIAEMKQYYGLNAPAQPAPAPVLVSAPVARVRTATPAPVRVKESPMQGPAVPPPVRTPEAAQVFKDEAVKEVIDNYPEEIDKYMSEWFEENRKDVRNSAIGLALGLGGIAYHQSRSSEEEE